MQQRRSLPPELARLGRHQAGVVARDQLLRGGLSRRCIGRLTSHWWRLARGIYWMGPPLPRAPWPALVWAGILLGGPGARAGLLTAAALDGLVGTGERLRGSDGSWRSVDEQVVIVAPARRGPHPGFVFLRERPGLRLRSTAREPARTRIEDTVLDLCAGADQAGVVMWLTRAGQRRLTTPARLRRRIEARPVVRNRALMLEILQDVSAGATSNLEHRALRDVFGPHGLPGVRLQHRTGSGRRVADAAIVEYRVLIELDGRTGHVEEGAFRDRSRDNEHTLDGWITLRFGWSDVCSDPCGVAAQIGELLTRLGWPGELTRCPRCPRSAEVGEG